MSDKTTTVALTTRELRTVQRALAREYKRLSRRPTPKQEGTMGFLSVRAMEKVDVASAYRKVGVVLDGLEQEAVEAML